MRTIFASSRMPGNAIRQQQTYSVLSKQTRLAIIFLVPWVLGFLGLQLYPIVASFYYSFTKFNLFQSPQWVGLGNYVSLFQSHLFYQALWNTVYYAVIGVGLHLVMGLGCALLLNLKVKGQAIYRTILFLPSVMPPVASALLWIWLLNPEYGLVDRLLGILHLPQPLWLASAVWAKPALILMSIWGVGGTMIIFLAGLQDIPQVYYEAVEIDGGGAWAKFRHITLPLISPITFFQLVMGLIGAFQIFTQAYVMSSATGSINVGGKDNALMFYSVSIYQEGFSFLKMGYASAMAWILLIIIMLITFLIQRTSKKWLFYGGN